MLSFSCSSLYLPRFLPSLSCSLPSLLPSFLFFSLTSSTNKTISRLYESSVPYGKMLGFLGMHASNNEIILIILKPI